MRPTGFIVAVVVGWALLGSGRAVEGQTGPLPFRDRPTLSPWLNLYRRDPGPVGPYLSNVRPQQRLLGVLSRQRTSLQRQNTAIRALGQRAAQTGQSLAGPTGVGATFMNLSHFFGGVGGPAAPARRGGPSWTPSTPSLGGVSGYGGF